MIQKSTQTLSGGAEAAHGPDYLGFLLLLWSKKIWIGAGVAAGCAVGILLAFTAKPVYKSWAVIAPKEPQGSSVGQGLLSQLGGLGSLVSGQFSFGQMNMDRMEIILRSRDLAESVLVRNDLLPRLFPDRWDAAKKEWRRGEVVPTLRNGVETLVNDVIYSHIDLKRKILEVGAYAPDSLLAVEMAGLLVDALNEKIKGMIESDAVANKAYLEEQLSKSGDPLLREKIQQLISLEIEKSMLVGSQSFYVLQSPFTPKFRDAPNRKRIVAVSAFCGFLFSIILVVGANSAIMVTAMRRRTHR